MSEKIQVVKGVAFWCDPRTVNKMAGKYTMKLGRLTDTQVAAFRQTGAHISFDTRNAPDSPDYQGYFVTFKSETPINPVDMAGKPLPDNMKIGNGSVVHVAFRVNSFVMKTTGKHVTSLKWLGLKVQELVKYDPEEANRRTADKLLDQISGDGFTFGETQDEGVSLDEDVNELFKDAS